MYNHFIIDKCVQVRKLIILDGMRKKKLKKILINIDIGACVVILLFCKKKYNFRKKRIFLYFNFAL
jgi:hypothetical protein